MSMRLKRLAAGALAAGAVLLSGMSAGAEDLDSSGAEEQMKSGFGIIGIEDIDKHDSTPGDYTVTETQRKEFTRINTAAGAAVAVLGGAGAAVSVIYLLTHRKRTEEE
ncbi:MAG: hypothetical protein IJ737_02390 [Ruminococcus sp.]|nr:hypothetical protein [Ruminococcus sp.]